MSRDKLQDGQIPQNGDLKILYSMAADLQLIVASDRQHLQSLQTTAAQPSAHSISQSAPPAPPAQPTPLASPPAFPAWSAGRFLVADP
ncbi:uncharacterized protein VTP21DRAFT_10191 [Calcarisporiella thermophila]|uniref:uncharacterized protein n=1 Tax=Calcarisporiella thermophila TaxID=911321 RepID=UPI0037429262